jgi:hypothetical protein
VHPDANCFHFKDILSRSSGAPSALPSQSRGA